MLQREFIYRYIKAIPLENIKIIYIDPVERGTNAGLMQKLAKDEKCRFFEPISTSKDDIDKKMREIESSIDEINAKIANYKDVYEYNKNEDDKIPYQLLFINDFPHGFERTTLERLETIINNSSKCGISIIINREKENSKKILSEQWEIGKRLENLIEKFTQYTEQEKGYTRGKNTHIYMEHFRDTKGYQIAEQKFIDQVLQASNKTKKIDNTYEGMKSKLIPTKLRDSAKDGLKIPFAVDRRGNLAEITLSGKSSNALISGAIGSGKSTTLHAIITSILLNYSPDDVELWLVDYKKVEFAEYIKNTPPHVKLIGLEKAKDFTYSLLNELKEKFEQRMQIFKEAGVKNLEGYRKLPNAKVMPRVVLIIDEFHNMTQTIQQETEYIKMLENALSEYRALGLSCIFSDQAISDGLRGLTEKARKQILSRMAMLNEMSEVKETLAVDMYYYTENFLATIRNLNIGDVIFKREIDGQVVIDKYKSLYITDKERTQIIKELQQKWKGKYEQKEHIIVDSQDRKPRDEEVIYKYQKKLPTPKKATIPLYLGTPATLEPCFPINLYRETDSNIMLVGSDENLRWSVIENAIKSFTKAPQAKVYVFIDSNNEIYYLYKNKIEAMQNEKMKVFTHIPDICQKIIETQEKIENYENDGSLLIIWIGLEEFNEEFEEAPKKEDVVIDANNKNKQTKTNKTEQIDSFYGNLLKGLDDLVASKKGKISKKEETLQPKKCENTENKDYEKDKKQIVYNACDDIKEIIKKGPRRGIHTFITYDSVRNLERTRWIKTEDFKHKIAFKLSADDSSEFLGRMRYTEGLDEQSAVYSDGGSEPKTFMPYK